MMMIGLVVGSFLVGFVAGALVMRRHYERIRAAEDALKKVVV